MFTQFGIRIFVGRIQKISWFSQLMKQKRRLPPCYRRSENHPHPSAHPPAVDRLSSQSHTTAPTGQSSTMTISFSLSGFWLSAAEDLSCQQQKTRGPEAWKKLLTAIHRLHPHLGPRTKTRTTTRRWRWRRTSTSGSTST